MQRSSSFLWDAFCILSVVGIWPRFIEPKLLLTTRLTLPIAHLPTPLKGLRIVQLSDLHLNRHTSSPFLDKIVAKIQKLQPDLLVLTGDFLCYSTLIEPLKLKTFLNQFKAPLFKIPLGCYAVLGNHDYQAEVSMNEKGIYDLVSKKPSLIKESLRRLFNSPKTHKGISTQAQELPPHQELIELLQESPFELLNNRSKQILVKNCLINVTGVGEHILNRCLPKEAFKDYNPSFPGIVLAHNPDCVPQLLDYPGDILLTGHTHGAQLNFPFLWNRFTQLEHLQFKRGLFKLKNCLGINHKWLYVNRGIGSVFPFRWFSPPEILLITLSE